MDIPWTPGPWHVEEDNDGSSRPSWLVQRVVPGARLGFKPWVATVGTDIDARLIAAAPEMAELLRRILDIRYQDEAIAEADVLLSRIWNVELGNVPAPASPSLTDGERGSGP